jgi:hypothetical protein
VLQVLSEARAQLAVHHPNIVCAYAVTIDKDYGDIDGLVIEYVAGMQLDDYIP